MLFIRIQNASWAVSIVEQLSGCLDFQMSFDDRLVLFSKNNKLVRLSVVSLVCTHRSATHAYHCCTYYYVYTNIHMDILPSNRYRWQRDPQMRVRKSTSKRPVHQSTHSSVSIKHIYTTHNTESTQTRSTSVFMYI